MSPSHPQIELFSIPPKIKSMDASKGRIEKERTEGHIHHDGSMNTCIQIC